MLSQVTLRNQSFRSVFRTMAPTFIFENALQDIFCYPLYIYPAFLCITMLSQISFIRIWDRLKLSMNRSKNIKDDAKDPLIVTEIAHSKHQQILQHFLNYTPLPTYIANIIINEYYHDSNIYRSHWQRKLSKRFKRFNVSLFAFRGISLCAQWSCMILIIWINIEWIIETECTAWEGFESLIISILMGHPASKLFNIICLLLPEVKEYSSLIFHASAILAVFIFIVWCCLFIIYVIPSFFYYMPIWFIVLFAVIVMVKCMEYEEYSERNTCIVICVFCSIAITVGLYVMVIQYTTSAMSCVYSNDIKGDKRWYLCLYDAFQSPYCPDTKVMNIKWSDWRAIVLFVAWIIFW